MNESTPAVSVVSCEREPITDIIGLIPAAGRALEFLRCPAVKNFTRSDSALRPARNGMLPKVVSHYLLEKMRFAGIAKVYFVLRAGKWDIPAYFVDGSILDMQVAYIVIDSTWGVTCTLDKRTLS